MTVTVIADDAGATLSIDEAVLSLARAGTLGGVAAFATFGSIRDLAGKLPTTCELGIHLNLSSGRPLARSIEIPSLVSSNGRFRDPRDFAGTAPEEMIENYVSMLQEEMEPDELALEFSLQVQRFIEDVGQPPAFASVHHDLDRLPAVADAVETATNLLGRQARLLNGDLSGYEYRLHPASASTSEVSHYFSDLVDRAIRDGGHWELICHPAASTDGLEEFTVYGQQRVSEYYALRGLAGRLSEVS